MHGFEYRDGGLHCEDVSVQSVAAAAGTPLYLYSAAVLRERYQAIAAAFSEIDATICFSVKSCSSLGVLNVLREAGSAFDVVSGGELQRVIRSGGDPARVVFAGVGKTDAEIRYALEQGIMMFNVESEAELENINRIAAEMGRTAPVALRLNPDVDPQTHRFTTTGKKENKFGLDLEIAGRLADGSGRFAAVRLNGVHVHIGSPVNRAAAYGEALDKALAFVAAHASAQTPFEYINAGGGFGLVYRDEQVPTFKEYAAEIIPRLQKSGRKLILEPGRAIAGNAGILVTTVQYWKSNGRKNFAITDAGMNALIRPCLYDAYHFIWPVLSASDPRGEGDPENALTNAAASGLIPVDVVGPICESSDFLALDRPLPELRRGDLLAVFSAGAYGFVMASTYNSQPRPAEVLVDGASWRVIRRRETWDDLIALEST